MFGSDRYAPSSVLTGEVGNVFVESAHRYEVGWAMGGEPKQALVSHTGFSFNFQPTHHLWGFQDCRGVFGYVLLTTAVLERHTDCVSLK